MAYISLADLRGRISEERLLEGLDDDGDGVSDVWTDVEREAAEQVDAYLSTRYTVPIQAPLPPMVRQATIIFAAEILYQRRGYDDNPYTEAANRWRTTLGKIASGVMPLRKDSTGPEPGAVVTYPTTIGEPGRRLI